MKSPDKINTPGIGQPGVFIRIDKCRCLGLAHLYLIREQVQSHCFIFIWSGIEGERDSVPEARRFVFYMA